MAGHSDIYIPVFNCVRNLAGGPADMQIILQRPKLAGSGFTGGGLPRTVDLLLVYANEKKKISEATYASREVDPIADGRFSNVNITYGTIADGDLGSVYVTVSDPPPYIRNEGSSNEVRYLGAVVLSATFEDGSSWENANAKKDKKLAIEKVKQQLKKC